MQDHLSILHSLPHAYLVMTPDFTIVDANPAYCALTLTDPDLIRGRDMFKVFPDNPGDPEANGVRNLTTSLKIVLSMKRTDRMPWQRYDIQDRFGMFQERHWSPINSPILDHNGEVKLIVHHVSDVTRVARKFPRKEIWPVA
jgi:PAS domain-containing protein